MRWIVSLFLFSSCIPNNSLETYAQSQQNVDNLIRVSSGMSTEEVMQIMHPPYRMETFQIGEDSYEAWFYVTKVTALGQGRLMHNNMTPLIFKDGILIGRGYDHYRWVLRSQEDYNAKEKEPAPLEHKEEDRSLEKSLDVTMSKAQKKPPEEPPPKKPPKDKPSKDKPPLTPKDDDFIDQESEQNFDYW